MRLVQICRSIIGGGETGESGKPSLASKLDCSTVPHTSTRPDDVLWREGKNSVAECAGGCATRITDGRRFRVLAFVDGYTRKRLALAANTSLSGLRVPANWMISFALPVGREHRVRQRHRVTSMAILR